MKTLRYFSPFEWFLILFSYTAILLTFFLFDGKETPLTSGENKLTF